MFINLQSVDYSLSIGLGIQSGRVGLMSPKCSSENMEECVNGLGFCGHDKDVFIKCRCKSSLTGWLQKLNFMRQISDYLISFFSVSDSKKCPEPVIVSVHSLKSLLILQM